MVSTFGDFADWLVERAEQPLDPERARTLAAFGIGSLLSTRLLHRVFGVEGPGADDEAVIGIWVSMLEPFLRA
jgi:hypothetical protein